MTEEISVRDQLLGILRTRYEFRVRFLEDLDQLIFDQEREGAIAALKDLFAFNSIPFTDGVPMIEDKPRSKEIEHLEAIKAINSLGRSGGLSCCNIFKGRRADVAATIAYDELKRVGEHGNLVRIISLGYLLDSKHVPNAEVRKELCNVLQPEEWKDTLAFVPELFGELSTIFRQGGGKLKTLEVASWLAMIECDQKTRAALIGIALSNLNEGVKEEKSILSGMHIITIG
jgi:hypothetical protein